MKALTLFVVPDNMQAEERRLDGRKKRINPFPNLLFDAIESGHTSSGEN